MPFRSLPTALRTTLLVCAAAVASPLVAPVAAPLAAQTIDTRTGELVGVVTTPNFGQTFTAPAGATFLNAFSFFVHSNTALPADPLVTFRAYLRATNGTHAVGDLLFSEEREADACCSLPQERFLTGGIPVVAGEQYVAFLIPEGGTLTSGFASLGGVTVNSYAGGQAILMNAGCVTSVVACPLGSLGEQDQAFIAEFSGGATSVPEPSALVLLALGMVAMVIGQRAKRSPV